MKEIVTDVRSWQWFSEPHGYDFNGHLLCVPGGNLCIDPVMMTPEELAELVRLGVSRILLTNRNHVRDANRVRARTGARTAIHPGDAGYARVQGADLDDELHVGEQVGPLRVLAVPGKSPGEIAFHWPERRILIVGDSIIGKPPGACSLLTEKVMDDPVQLRSSVRALLDVDFDCLLVGDGASILAGAKDRLAELVEGWGK
jgi:glyoxylase-like metal-dependent hydrolase (beta-lactamase superfamily II)